MKFQVVSWVNHKSFFTGTDEECQQWLSDYGLGISQFDVLPFDSKREIGDISETY